MPNFQCKRMKADNSAHELDLTITPNGPGKWRVLAGFGGEGPVLADVAAQISEATQAQVAALLKTEFARGITDELAVLEKNQSKHEASLVAAAGVLAEVAKKRADKALALSPDAPAIWWGLDREEAAAKEIARTTEAVLGGVKARLAGLRQALRAEKAALAGKVLEEMRARLLEEKERAAEALLKAAGKALDHLAGVQARLQALGLPDLKERLAALGAAA